MNIRAFFVLAAACCVASCNGLMETPMTDVPTASPANGAMWGTDAHLSPSRPDVVLRYADHPRGFAELRLPTGEGPFPLAVIFHGGCFKYGVADQAYMAPLATRWQDQGIASLNVDYREVGDGGGWPGSFADWAAAAKLIDDVAARYPVDRERVTLVGHSAGALPALWLAARQGPDGPVGQRPALRARAAIVLDGPADFDMEAGAFDALCQFSAVGPFLGEEGAKHVAAIAPRPLFDDVLFVQARLPVPPPAALAAIRAAGARLDVRENPQASHFAIITPGDPVYAANESAMLKVLTSE